MPLHHYLPATYLALFSTDTFQPRRQRILVAGDKESGNLFSAPASRIAGINDLYTITSSNLDPQIVDTSLSHYESSFYIAVEQLINHQVTAMAWASILVPFVAALMVRGPDFNDRFEARILSLGVDSPSDNTNFGRLVEFQRLLAPVAAAQWNLLSVQGADLLITNDLGYAPFANYQTQEFGIAVPLGLRHILAISPQTCRVLAFSQGGEWLPTINFIDAPPDDHVQLNHVISSFSRRFVFGPDTSTLSLYFSSARPSRGNPEPGQLGFMDGYLAMMHDMTWHRLITALSTAPSRDGEYIYVDFLRSDR